jgi:hypothetical protein
MIRSLILLKQSVGLGGHLTNDEADNLSHTAVKLLDFKRRMKRGRVVV